MTYWLSSPDCTVKPCEVDGWLECERCGATIVKANAVMVIRPTDDPVVKRFTYLCYPPCEGKAKE